MSNDRSSPFHRGAALLVLGVFLVATLDLGVLAFAARADAREDLAKAEDYFLVADFGTALGKVDELLDSGDLTGDALRDAYVLKARCELGLVHRSSAVDAFCNAVRIDPQWRPDPDFYTKDELEVFEQARTTCGAGSPSGPVDDSGGTPPPPMPASVRSGDGGEPWYKNKMVLGGIGGAVALGLIIALASGGDDDEGAPQLPFFPDPPEN